MGRSHLSEPRSIFLLLAGLAAGASNLHRAKAPHPPELAELAYLADIAAPRPLRLSRSERTRGRERSSAGGWCHGKPPRHPSPLPAQWTRKLQGGGEGRTRHRDGSTTSPTSRFTKYAFQTNGLALVRTSESRRGGTRRKTRNTLKGCRSTASSESRPLPQLRPHAAAVRVWLNQESPRDDE